MYFIIARLEIVAKIEIVLIVTTATDSACHSLELEGIQGANQCIH